ncbi:MAG: hypothetical protein IT491_04755 [Gammaproteobacteria bacterium]|jgi:hypothetical protein|nr:hypothetical protein [Gammaproteobacteria bacterium]
MLIQSRIDVNRLVSVLGGIILALTGWTALAAGEVLEQRVRQYWEARQINDILTYYHLESATLPGGKLTPDKYRLAVGLPVRDVKIQNIKVEGDKAEVQLEGKVEVGALGWVPQPLTDVWVLVNGEWYHRTSGF